MRQLLAPLIVLVMLFTPARAEPLNAADKSAVEAVITSQLEAFSRDDGAGAYDFAAPLIRQIFPTAGQFMAMVKQGYQPVYRSQNHAFAESFTDQLGRPAQKVLITGQDGKRYQAVYTMELQPDGIWKIAGCQLLPVAEVGA
jgi:hypothetical protein